MATYPYSLTIVNPGAEAGNTTGWTNVTGTLAAINTGGGNNPRTGSWFFRAGATASTSAYQDITLPAEVLDDVDNGRLSIVGIGYHAGFDGDADSGWLYLKFKDSEGTDITDDMRMVNTHSPQGSWRKRQLSGIIPPLTRTIRLGQVGSRDGGTNLDSYWDDFSLTLYKLGDTIVEEAATLVNPGAETGNITGWTDDPEGLGTLQSITTAAGNTPRSGSRFFGSGTGSPMSYYQTVNIPTDLITLVESDALAAKIVFYQSGFTDGDLGVMAFQFYDSGNSIIDERIECDFETAGVNEWREREVSCLIPRNTRSLRIYMYASKVDGANNDVYYDDISLTFTYAESFIGDGGNFVGETEKVAGGTFNASTSLVVNEGELAVVVLATDNEDSSDGNSTLHSSVSLDGNPMTKLREFTNSQGQPNNGATVSAWYWLATQIAPSGSILTSTLNTGRTAKAVTGHVFNLNNLTISTAPDGVSDLAADSGNLPALSGTGSEDTLHLWIRGSALENADVTLGAFTPTNGWIAMNGVGTAGNPDTSNMSVRAEYKVSTGLISGESNPSSSGTSNNSNILAGISFVESEIGGGGGGNLSINSIIIPSHVSLTPLGFIN